MAYRRTYRQAARIETLAGYMRIRWTYFAIPTARRYVHPPAGKMEIPLRRTHNPSMAPQIRRTRGPYPRHATRPTELRHSQPVQARPAGHARNSAVSTWTCCMLVEAGLPSPLWHFMDHSLFPDIVYLHSFHIRHVGYCSHPSV